MKKLKNYLSVVLVTVLLFSSFTGMTVNAGSLFSDLSESHWSYPYVEYMVNQGIVSGYPDGTFQPEEPFSRAAFAKLLTLAFDIPLYNGYDQFFQDVYTYDWSYPYVMAASEYLTYYDYGGGMYYYFPEDDAEREDVAVAMVQAMGLDPTDANLSYLDAYYDSGDVSYNLREYVALAIEYGVMQGSNGYFNPRASLTRAEGCTLFARFLTDIKGTYETASVDATDSGEGYWVLTSRYTESMTYPSVLNEPFVDGCTSNVTIKPGSEDDGLTDYMFSSTTSMREDTFGGYDYDEWTGRGYIRYLPEMIYPGDRISIRLEAVTDTYENVGGDKVGLSLVGAVGQGLYSDSSGWGSFSWGSLFEDTETGIYDIYSRGENGVVTSSHDACVWVTASAPDSGGETMYIRVTIYVSNMQAQQVFYVYEWVD